MIATIYIFVVVQLDLRLYLHVFRSIVPFFSGRYQVQKLDQLAWLIPLDEPYALWLIHKRLGQFS